MINAMENECKEAENDLRQEFEASREEIKVVKDNVIFSCFCKRNSSVFYFLKNKF